MERAEVIIRTSPVLDLTVEQVALKLFNNETKKVKNDSEN